jgi:hypothetical protein
MPVNNVHDLLLAAAEVYVGLGGHGDSFPGNFFNTLRGQVVFPNC